MSYQPPPQGPYYQQMPPESGNATAALLLGIAGIFVCPIVCSILAIVYGKKAYSEIDASNGYMRGRGQAQAGIVLGWVGLGLCVAGVLAFVALIVLSVGSATLIESS
jgi:hypothetical protein